MRLSPKPMEVSCFCMAVTLLALCHGAIATRSSIPVAQKGTITIQHQTRTEDSQLLSLASLGQPMSVDSLSQASATPVAMPAVKSNIKRIYFRSNCSCSDSANSPYPMVALSYKPVQSADFYNIGYWSVTGCDAKYIVATTEGVMGIHAEMSDGSWVWDGNKPLTVYVPSENKCAGRKRFVQYDLPLDWQDHTVYLNC